MNKSQTTDLKREYAGQRVFSAKEEGYTFDVLSDEWQLGYKKLLRLGWMNELNVDPATFLDLRLAIAHTASRYAYNSITGFVSRLKNIVDNLDVNEFQAWWLTLDRYKKNVRDGLFAFCQRSDDYHSTTLSPLYESIKDENLGRNSGTKGILDIKSGAYSEIEHDNILEVLRIETLQALDLDSNLLTQQKFTRLRNVIASQLMVAIVRRPVQLVQIKWCDVLRVGQEFQSHKEPDRKWEPITQHLFSDVEQLHLRTFKGKDGEFRFNAESRSHRLEPDCSQMLLRYYQAYENYLSHQLQQSRITLSPDEMTEVMRRLPLLPDQSLFSSEYQSESELFRAISDTSQAYHLQPAALLGNLDYLFKAKLNAQSDRLPDVPLALKNNRWRHTQLTQAVWQGFSPAQIASITGVTIQAIEPYIDLKAPERVKIDQAYAGNQIIKKFDTTSVKELKKDNAFCVKSPFDEEMGYKLNPDNCSSCKSKGGAPMGCYPCDNFRPLETANHQQYLDKAERKLELNSQSGHPATVKKLNKIINYIKATIAICNERKIPKLGDHQ
ncbi:hypothetical protein [Endozoicomonas euniceicola]|uniref:Phage integrase family protein n=1 Tax=Endozoicomonas euniceicola TaxID=1234143 RepID=A0ABY6GPB8_9GAMM|nr:hypothetical protein [Endozoicomonas euniceicola]UYM14601.1 hypothetical protein NX720_17110 [Endozoicomonas euniceicola]